ncbi:unnamed protein product [Amoebophrya sp. A25]|nr:unnamed protein product [Amoebophrya sp. A25]|eukprot:GSA25T00002379001.1
MVYLIASTSTPDDVAEVLRKHIPELRRSRSINSRAAEFYQVGGEDFLALRTHADVDQVFGNLDLALGQVYEKEDVEDIRDRILGIARSARMQSIEEGLAPHAPRGSSKAIAHGFMTALMKNSTGGEEATSRSSTTRTSTTKNNDIVSRNTQAEGERTSAGKVPFITGKNDPGEAGPLRLRDSVPTRNASSRTSEGTTDRKSANSRTSLVQNFT